jgi:hypothetical protein
MRYLDGKDSLPDEILARADKEGKLDQLIDRMVSWFEGGCLVKIYTNYCLLF